MAQKIDEDIKNKAFASVYLLFGEEGFLVQSAKRRLKAAVIGEDTMNYHYFTGKDVSLREVMSLADTMPFFAERRLILLEDSGFFKKSPDELVDYLDRIPETTCLVFVESDVDKRSRLYKKVQKVGCITEFTKKKPEELARWAARFLKEAGKNISGNTMEEFLARTGNDMAAIRTELEKLISYTGDRNVVTREDVETVTTVQTENRIFEMVEAITAGNTEKAMKLYRDLLAMKEPPMRILFLIGRQWNQLMVVSEMTERGSRQGDIASALKVQPFVARKLMAQVRGLSREKILAGVRQAVELDEAVKNGRITDRLAVELMIAG